MTVSAEYRGRSFGPHGRSVVTESDGNAAVAVTLQAMASASHAETVRASCAECFAAITDFESYPEWQTAVESVEVRSRDDAGRGREVGFVIDLKLRRVRYALIYEYAEPTDLHWRYAGGDVKDIAGSYSFRPTRTPGVVEARYTLEVDFGFPVPALIRRSLQQEVMRRSVRELKTRVETRAEWEAGVTPSAP